MTKKINDLHNCNVNWYGLEAVQVKSKTNIQTLRSGMGLRDSKHLNANVTGIKSNILLL